MITPTNQMTIQTMKRLTGELYSSQATTRIAPLLTKRRRALAWATACLMLTILAPAVVTSSGVVLGNETTDSDPSALYEEYKAILKQRDVDAAANIRAYEDEYNRHKMGDATYAEYETLFDKYKQMHKEATAKADKKFKEYKAAFAADKASADEDKSIQDKHFAEYKRLMAEYRTMHNGALPTLNAEYKRIFAEYETVRKPAHARMVVKKERKRKLYNESRILRSRTPTKAMLDARRKTIDEANAIHPREGYNKTLAEINVIKDAAEAKVKATYDATIKRALDKKKQADQALASFKAAGGKTK